MLSLATVVQFASADRATKESCSRRCLVVLDAAARGVAARGAACADKSASTTARNIVTIFVFFYIFFFDCDALVWLGVAVQARRQAKSNGEEERPSVLTH